MDKQELIEKLERQELARLNTLTLPELQDQVRDWFCLEEEEDIKRLTAGTNTELINRYMNNYMEWKHSYSADELLSVLNN